MQDEQTAVHEDTIIDLVRSLMQNDAERLGVNLRDPYSSPDWVTDGFSSQLTYAGCDVITEPRADSTPRRGILIKSIYGATYFLTCEELMPGTYENLTDSTGGQG